jgi:hypothetical protein
MKRYTATVLIFFLGEIYAFIVFYLQNLSLNTALHIGINVLSLISLIFLAEYIYKKGKK